MTGESTMVSDYAAVWPIALLAPEPSGAVSMPVFGRREKLGARMSCEPWRLTTSASISSHTLCSRLCGAHLRGINVVLVQMVNSRCIDVDHESHL